MLRSHPSNRAHARHAGTARTWCGGSAACTRVPVRARPQMQPGALNPLHEDASADSSAAASGPSVEPSPAALQQWPSPPPQQQQQQDVAVPHEASLPAGGSVARATTAVLGSPPGVVWHIRTRGSGLNGANGQAPSSSSSSSIDADWTVQYAASAILRAFDPNGTLELQASSNSSSSKYGSISPDGAEASIAASPSDAAALLAQEIHQQQQQLLLLQQQQQQQQQQWPADLLMQEGEEQQQEQEQQQQQQEQQQQQQQQLLVPPDFTLLQRLASNAAASSSGKDNTWPVSSNSSSSSGSSQQSGVQQQAWQDTSTKSLSSSFEPAATSLRWMQQGPGANFRDPRFEQALSRWIKEAPEWYKVRTVYERFGWRFNIINLACCWSKLADLFEPLGSRRMLRKERGALRQFLEQLLQDTAALLPSVDAGTAAALLDSMARLAACGKVRRSPQLVSSLLQHLAPQLGSLKPNELACTLWCLSRLNMQPPAGWLEALFAATRPTLPALRGDEVAVLVRGLAGVQAQPPPQAWLSALLSHAEGQLEEMQPQHLSMLLIGLAKLQVRPNRSWMDAAMSALRSKFEQMGPQALSNVMWALSLMGCLPDRSWLSSYFSTTLLLLNSFNAKELAVGLWALSRMRLEPSDEWLDEYFDQSEAKLTGFSLRDLCLCGYSLAKLGLRPPQTWLRRYCTLLLRLKAGLWHQKALLTQVLVALDSFKVPRLDMWRRELYAAAGYKLYKYTNWRQRVKLPQSSATPVPFGSRRRFGRFGRRSSGSSLRGSSTVAGGVLRGSGFRAAGAESTGRKPGVGAVPVVLRSGDWGVLDGMGGGRGVLGSMGGSYEELGSGSSAGADTADAAPSSSSSSTWSSREEATSSVDAPASGRAAAGAGRAAAGSGSGSKAAAVRSPQGWTRSASPRPLRAAGLVRPPPPPSAAPAAPGAAAATQAGTSANGQQ